MDNNDNRINENDQTENVHVQKYDLKNGNGNMIDINLLDEKYKNKKNSQVNNKNIRKDFRDTGPNPIRTKICSPNMKQIFSLQK